MAIKKERLDKISTANAPIVGVAISIMPLGNTHTGVIYRDADNHVLFLHLEFHLRLKNTNFDTSYLCADPCLETEDAEAVAGYCRLLANGIAPIQFAIHYNTIGRFVKRKEQVVLTKEGKGLNCSTFVMTIFNSAGNPLIDFERWPKRPTDIIWHQKLIAFLKSEGATLNHIKKVAKDIGCARVRPEEVVGACLEAPAFKVPFLQCEMNGDYVVEEIEKHTKRNKVW